MYGGLCDESDRKLAVHQEVTFKGRRKSCDDVLCRRFSCNDDGLRKDKDVHSSCCRDEIVFLCPEEMRAYLFFLILSVFATPLPVLELLLKITD